MKKLFTALILLCFAHCSAVAEAPLGEYSVTEPSCHTDALLRLTFGETVPPLVITALDDGTLSWGLADAEGLPICTSGASLREAVGVQARFSIYRVPDETNGHTYWYNLGEWNTIPSLSGFDAPRAAEFTAMALALCESISAAEWQPVSFSAMGSMEGTTKCYRVVLEQTLNGLPVRWSQVALDQPRQVYGCYADVIYSDEDGLLKADGCWCGFTPRGNQAGMIDANSAADLFAQQGMNNSAPEACYFLTTTDDSAQATLAWRVGNSYLSATTGEWLQISR